MRCCPPYDAQLRRTFLHRQTVLDSVMIKYEKDGFSSVVLEIGVQHQYWRFAIPLEVAFL